MSFADSCLACHPDPMLLSTPSSHRAHAWGPQIFPSQPSISLTDDFGNTVLSDCLVNASACVSILATTPCTYNTSRCEPMLSVGFENASVARVSRITGQTEKQAILGTYDFKDLGIQADLQGQRTCLCSANGQCPQCSEAQCAMPPPFPNYSLRFSSDQAGVESITRHMILSRYRFAC